MEWRKEKKRVKVPKANNAVFFFTFSIRFLSFSSSSSSSSSSFERAENSGKRERETPWGCRTESCVILIHFSPSPSSLHSLCLPARSVRAARFPRNEMDEKINKIKIYLKNLSAPSGYVSPPHARGTRTFDQHFPTDESDSFSHENWQILLIQKQKQNHVHQSLASFFRSLPIFFINYKCTNSEFNFLFNFSSKKKTNFFPCQFRSFKQNQPVCGARLFVTKNEGKTRAIFGRVEDKKKTRHLAISRSRYGRKK